MKILIDVIVTTFYIGKLPLAPGTWASIAATISWLFIFDATNSILVPLYSIILFFVGVYFSHLSLKKSNDHDPSYIVIDEWVGQWVALSFIPVNLNFAIVGFILFRFFDITKIGPVKYFEKIPGALGVMSDDIAAGLMSAIVIFIARIVI